MTGVSEGGTYRAIINYSATVLTGAAIKTAQLGGAEDAETAFAVNQGPNSGIIDKSGVKPGTAYLHGTIEDLSGLFSTDVPRAFTQPAPTYVDQGTNDVKLTVASAAMADSANFTFAMYLNTSATAGTDLMLTGTNIDIKTKPGTPEVNV